MKHTEYIIPIGEDAEDYDEIFIGVIRKQPELIRCKDCKHCMIFSVYKTKWYVCTNHVESIDVEAEDFCSKAERGNNEAD